MLFFVKVKIDVNKLNELGQKIQNGYFEFHPEQTHCLKEHPSVGLNIWEAENFEDFEQKFAPHRPFYTDVYEVTPIITAVEAQQKLIQQMEKG